MRSYLKLLCVAFLSLLMIGCGKKTPSDETLYYDYISAYTQGNISRYSSIQVVLTQPCDDARPGEEVSEKVFSLSPSVEGTTVWVDNYTLEFHPKELLERGKEYKVTFELGKVANLGSNKDLKQFIFPVTVVRQKIYVMVDTPQLTDEGDYQVKGTVSLADREELENLKECFSAAVVSPKRKQLDMEWREGSDEEGSRYNHNSFTFVVSGFERGVREDQKVEILWNGTRIDCDSEEKATLLIPYVSGFKMTDLNVVGGENPYLKLYFSQPLKPDQTWRTYVKINDESSQFTREGNVLKVYPEKVSYSKSTLKVYAGLKGVNGDALMRDTTIQFAFVSEKPQVRLVNSGAILPRNDKATLPFEAVNLKSVDVDVVKVFDNNMLQYLQSSNLNVFNKESMKRTGRLILHKKIDLPGNSQMDYYAWRTFSLDLSELSKEDPGAMYRVYFSFKRAYSTYPCEITDSIDDSDHSYSPVSELEDHGEDSYGYYYDEEYYDDDYYSYNSSDNGDYAYNWNDREDPSKITYYLCNGRGVATNVFVSNFGIIAKGGKSNFYEVIVTDLLTTAPMKGVRVTFYDYQMQEIDNEETDGDGFVSVRLSRTPSFVVVEKDGQMGYLRVRDNNALSLSSFDVSGSDCSKGIKGYIYGERGVWRPGDTLNISLMLQDADETLPKDHPITMNLRTPRGQTYARSVQKYDPNCCIYSFRIPTKEDDQTGNWSISFNVGGSNFYKQLKIETIKPNRLKVRLSAANKVLVSGTREQLNVHSEWLHGGKSADKEVEVTLRCKRNPNAFPAYQGYIFEAPDASNFVGEENTVMESTTDDNGDASESVAMPEVSDAPGMLQAVLTTKVFEGTGDFSVNYETLPFSPYSRYIGVKYPNQKEGRYIVTNRDQTFDLLLVDPKGNPVTGDGITFKLYKMQWRWWWDASNDNSFAYYTENTYQKPYFEKKNIRAVNGRASVTVNIPNSDWGRYMLVVSNGQSGHKVGGVVFFDWDCWSDRNMENGGESATMLAFNLDKEKYQVGEKVKVTLPTPSEGRILVTVENRTKVLVSKWIDAQPNTTTFEMEVTREMMPNAYLYVNLLQPYERTSNDLPIRMYGVKNFMVESVESVLHPVIKMDDKVESEKSFDVTVSEANGKDMCYTLAIVDNGLLDLTNFKTPNAHSDFFKREALGVNSWDMYNMVIGAYGGKIEQLFSIGGDMALNRDGLNRRFEPVVKFYGPIQLKAGEKKTHNVKLPPYFGSVRVMVVAGNKMAYGNAEKEVKVTKPLMILPTAPRVIGPKEEFNLPVNVFTMDGVSKNVKLSVEAGNKISVLGERTLSQQMTGNDDKIMTFRMKAGGKLGKEKISVSATDGTTTVKSEINLDVRNPNERITQHTFYEVPAGGTVTCPIELFGSEGTNQVLVEMSALPPLNLAQSMEYLVGYPHGCAEQTTSKAFPQLLLPEITEVSESEKTECTKNVKAAIFKLSQMQMSSGSFSYWMGGSYDYPWVTNYVGHFLIEAKNHGYDVPNSVISQFCAYQKRTASSWSYRKNRDYEKLEQAYRLYTLALAGKPDLGAMNRLKEMSLDNATTWQLASAYALCGKKDVAKNMCASLSSEAGNSSSHNFGSALRDKALILNAMITTDADRKEAYHLLKRISEDLSKSKQYSTQELANVLVAFANFAKGQPDRKVNAVCEKDGAKVTFSGDCGIIKRSLEVGAAKSQKAVLKNNGQNTLYVTMAISGIPEENMVGAMSNGLDMSVKYSTLGGESFDPTAITQGEDFMAEVTVRNTSSVETYQEVALTQVFPSGWEIQNDRMSNMEEESQNYSYRDVRDDRVMTYFSLSPGEKKSFKVKLHASFIGKYYAPSVICESMYDSEIAAKNTGFWATVKK